MWLNNLRDTFKNPWFETGISTTEVLVTAISELLLVQIYESYYCATDRIGKCTTSTELVATYTCANSWELADYTTEHKQGKLQCDAGITRSIFSKILTIDTPWLAWGVCREANVWFMFPRLLRFLPCTVAWNVLFVSPHCFMYWILYMLCQKWRNKDVLSYQCHRGAESCTLRNPTAL